MFSGRDIDRMFGAMDLLRNRMDWPFPFGPAAALTASPPRTNILETDDTIEVQAEVPGLSKDDLSVKIQGNYLEISGKREVNAPEDHKVHRRERGSSSFSRSFTLPEDVDADKTEAVLRDGILYLTLPKSETARPRRIAIN